MFSTDVLLRVCELGLEGKTNELISYIQTIAVKESNAGRQNIFNKLTKILNNYTTNNFSVSSSKSIDNIIRIPPRIKKEINTFFKYLTTDKNLGVSWNRLLLYGPPGTGKTTIGLNIAKKINYPIKYVKISDILGSRLGETLKNIDDLFKSDEKEIIFLDEFDAFSKDRKDINEIGELKRTVNSFIQTLDRCPLNKIVIVSTNIIEQIDPAILRRFKFKINIDYLNIEEKTDFIRDYINTINNHINLNLDVDDITFLAHIDSLKSIDDIVTLLDKTLINCLFNYEVEVMNINNIFETMFIDNLATKDDIKLIRSNFPEILAPISKKLTNHFSQLELCNLI